MNGRVWGVDTGRRVIVKYGQSKKNNIVTRFDKWFNSYEQVLSTQICKDANRHARLNNWYISRETCS